jgi:hypothetical protein
MYEWEKKIDKTISTIGSTIENWMLNHRVALAILIVLALVIFVSVCNHMVTPTGD